MGRLPRVLPMSIKAKLFWGLLFLIEAQIEVILGFQYIPKYFVQIIGPVDVLWITSSIFATSFGAIALARGVIQVQEYYNAKHEIDGATLFEYYKKFFHRSM